MALILGIAGACRREELANLSVDDIEDRGSALVVTIKTSKTKIQRVFPVVDHGSDSIKYLEIIRRYASLRPSHTTHRPFFLFYKDGKCSTQVIGKNTFGLYPARIATFLKLPEPSTYTGHCFRRSSATLLADGGADLTQLKRHGGWKSATTAEGYIEDSVENKLRIASTVLHGRTMLNNNATDVEIVGTTDENITHQATVNSVPSSVTVSNCNNCQININVNVK